MRRAVAPGLAGLLIAAVALAPPAARAEDDEGDSAEARKELLEKTIAALLEDDNEAPRRVLDGVDPRRASAAELKAIRILKTKRVNLRIEKQTLEGAIAILRELSGLNFVVSRKAREAAEAEPVEITMELDDLPLENIVNLIALQMKGYRFILRYGAVLLIRDEEHRPRNILRVYDVSDVVRPRPDFPAPALGLGGLGEEKR
jgi:hypothetical protein